MSMTSRPANASPIADSSCANTKWSRRGTRFMSVRKTAAAKVATKPTAKLAPEPAKRTNAKKATPPAKSAPGTIQNVSAAAERLAAEIDRALAEGRTDVLTLDAIQALMAAA